MKTVIIVQARMASTRLPGKVLKEVLGKPLLEYQIERLKQVANADGIVVATTNNASDDPIIDLCKKLSIAYFRGDEHNVLSRYFHAAERSNAKAIVRITGDCPLIDPAIVTKVIAYYRDHVPAYDYVSNVLQRTYPRGMDTEVFSFQALTRTFKEAKTPSDREHVTSYIYNIKNSFRLGGVQDSTNNGNYRLTVDTQEDFELIKIIIETLYPANPEFTLQDILFCLDVYPEWVAINAHVEQKAC